MTRKQIGSRLRTIRQLRGLTQQELGSAIGVGKEVVNRTEGGKREMAYHEAVAYAQVLCFCLNAFARTKPDGIWDITACLLPYPPPAKQTDRPNHGTHPQAGWQA
ncbi:MAG: helix-turn-helix transcriptional regulator [Flavobacteriales bacterium]|nr:helix-turn-helix transcriptional regulator [Flavobacteriales bacterium]